MNAPMPKALALSLAETSLNMLQVRWIGYQCLRGECRWTCTATTELVAQQEVEDHIRSHGLFVGTSMSTTGEVRPVDDSCPECYIAGSVDAFRKQHEAERDELIALRAEVAQFRQQRDKWLAAFNRSAQFQDGPTKRAEVAESRLATLTAALEGLKFLWTVHASGLRTSWAADENEAVALAFEMCAARLAALEEVEEASDASERT